MNIKSQKKITGKKLNNESFPALLEITPIKDSPFSFGVGLINLTSVLSHQNWDFKDRDQYPCFHSLGLSMCNKNRAGAISKYQKFCIIKLSSILCEARLLYENNLIDFSQLRDIVARVKKDAFKRFNTIKKDHAKKQLADSKLDSESLILLQAKLAILENEN